MATVKLATLAVRVSIFTEQITQRLSSTWETLAKPISARIKEQAKKWVSCLS